MKSILLTFLALPVGILAGLALAIGFCASLLICIACGIEDWSAAQLEGHDNG